MNQDFEGTLKFFELYIRIGFVKILSSKVTPNMEGEILLKVSLNYL